MKTTLVAVFVLFVCSPFVQVADAGNSITRNRGPQSPAATIWWQVISGSGLCAPSTNYPNLPDNVRANWMSGNKSLNGNMSFGQISAPGGAYWFRCTHTSDATRYDESTINVQECVSPLVWNGSACVAAPPTIGSFTNNGPIPYNTTATLTWTVSGATSCSISGIGGVSASGGSVNTPNLTTNTPYTLTCSNSNGSAPPVGTTVIVNPPASCPLPWGGSIPSGSSVTAYQAPSVPSPGPCVSQTKTCTNGVLSGTYTNQTCVVNPPVVNGACGTSNGGTFASQPSSNLCSAGTVAWTDTTAGDGTYNWNCNGAGGGTNASCSANLAVATPDLSAVNGSPAPGASFTSSQSITFTGTAQNSAAAAIAQGGWADLEIDWNSDGTQNANYNAFGGAQLGSFTPSQSKALSYTLPAGVAPIGTHRYRFNVDVTNVLNEGGSEGNNRSAWSGSFTISTNPGPTTDAGVDRSIALPTDQVTIPAGAASASDADGVASTIWSFVSGPGPIPTLINQNTLTPTFDNMTSSGAYTFRLTATDSFGASGSDTMIVNVGAAAVNGACGGASQNYPANASSFSGAFCSAGTPSPASPTFPSAPGVSTNWTCLGQNGGSNSGTCTAARGDGNLTVSSCSIPVGGTECPVTVSWSNTGAISDPRVFQGTSQIGSSASNPGISVDVPHGSTMFSFYDGPYGGSSPLLDGQLVTITCTPGGAWAAGQCVSTAVPPTLTVRQGGSVVNTVTVGTQVSVEWDTNNGVEASCSLTGGELSYSALPAGGNLDPETGSANATINGRVTFTLTCPGVGNTVTRTIDVIPINWET